MKTIPNKITKFPAPFPTEAKPNACFSDLLISVLDNPPREGFSPSVMRVRTKIVGALEAVPPGGEITLEDADYDTVVSALKAMPWRVRSLDLISLFDAMGI